MKTTKKILIVLALAFIGFGANAQQDVKQYSVRKYTSNGPNAATNDFKWVIEKGGIAADPADYEVWESYTKKGSVTIGDWNRGQSEIYIKWKTLGADYAVRVIERNGATLCTDSDNDKTQLVAVTANTFTVDVAWDGKTTPAGVSCANSGVNDIVFTITRTDGSFGTTVDVNDHWNFQYEYSIDGGATWKPATVAVEDIEVEGVTVKGFSVLKAETTKKITIKETIPTGNSDFICTIRIKDARDGYGALATALPKTAVATIHQLPTTSVIGVD